MHMHVSAYVSIRQHTSAYVRRQHSIRQYARMYVCRYRRRAAADLGQRARRRIQGGGGGGMGHVVSMLQYIKDRITQRPGEQGRGVVGVAGIRA